MSRPRDPITDAIENCGPLRGAWALLALAQRVLDPARLDARGQRRYLTALLASYTTRVAELAIEAAGADGEDPAATHLYLVAECLERACRSHHPLARGLDVVAWRENLVSRLGELECAIDRVEVMGRGAP
jgi:hypothetical protein